MRFYTNVKLIGNYIFCRGYDDGLETIEKIKYEPTLYVPSNKKTEYLTLENKYVSPIKPGTISDTRKFVEKYKDVDGFEYYGNSNGLYQYISDSYPEEVIDFDINQIKLYVLDIETTAEQGTIDAQAAREEILLITIQDYASKSILTWGTRSFTEQIENHTYIECENEAELLLSFLDFWENNYPDVVTGWNCVPTNSNIWTNDKIKKIKNVNLYEKLYDSNVVNIFPTSIKKAVEQKLANGASVISSYGHIFPYTLCPPDYYTKFTESPKNKSYQKDLSVKDVMLCNDEKFLFVPLRENKNVDNSLFSYDDCYLLGLIYTDGSLKSKDRIGDGFTFYQSDLEFVQNLKDNYNISSKILGPYNNCYHLHIPFRIMPDISPIFQGNIKDLNLEILSTFSQKQFYMFLSGLLDGDGCFSGGRMLFCNYNDDIKDLYELSLWNGIFSTINSNNTLLNFIDIDFKQLSLRKSKRWNTEFKYKKLKRQSSAKAKQTRFKKVNGGYLVKVLNFKELNEIEMMDIETNTHYFISSGVKTHNCAGFDIPYIINRIAKNFGEKEATRLSIWKKLSTREFTLNGREEIEHQIYGITVLDYLQLFKKFAFISVENYRLNTVAEEVLKENKLDHDEYETFKDFYTQNFSLFVKYNVQDCILITKFEKKLCLIKLAFTLAYQAKVNPEDVYYQGRMWDGIIYNYLRRQGIVIPSKKEVIEKTEKFKGAHVKEPQVGKFKYVCSLDLASLYPSLIRTYNISPETLVNERNNYVSIEGIAEGNFQIKSEHSEYAICPNGSMYRKEKQGFLPTIMEKMFNERTVYKKKMLQAQSLYEQNPSEELEEKISMYKIYQHALKICLNSAFGSLGNAYFRFYDIRNAEAITYSGQVVIKWIEKKLNVYLNNVAGTKNVDMILGADTDSVVGDSIIRVDENEIKISEFFDSIPDNYLKYDTFNNNYVKKVFDRTALSLSKDGNLENKKIKYVMKHKVNKRLYKIKANGKFVVVTEDHSIIVKNKKTGKIQEIKPKELSNEKHNILYIID